MSRLFQDLTEQFMTGVGCPKSSARHKAISSNEPLPQFNLAHCLSYGLHLIDSLLMRFHETNLTLPRPFFFSLVSSSLSSYSWIIAFIPVINFQVFFFLLLTVVSLPGASEKIDILPNLETSISIVHPFIQLSINLLQIALLCVKHNYMYWVNETKFLHSQTFNSSGGDQKVNKQIDKHICARWQVTA